VSENSVSHSRQDSLSFNGATSSRTDAKLFAADDPDEPIIVCRNVHKTYLLGLEGVPALRGVSVTVNRGEFIVILGKSGGGKTTMLNIFGTIDKPTKGELKICGQSIRESTTDEEFARLRLDKIGFVFQTFNLIGSMNALDNVSLPMTLAGRLSPSQIRARSTRLLTQVGMAARVDHLPSQLSGGEQQRVTIARSLANDPELLLLDEPTGDLDSVNSAIIMKALVELNREQNITCIMVTHDRAMKAYAHRVLHMLDGKIFRIESIPQSVRDAADAEVLDYLERGESEKKESENAATTEYRDVDFYQAAHGSAIPL
jgi:putative ABC transport system ATP-binding protein